MSKCDNPRRTGGSIARGAVAVVLLLGAVALLGLSSCQGIAWKVVNRKVRHDFPEVKRMETGQLARWLHDSRRPPPLLLDVRTQAEYDVSHLHGARRVEPDSDAAQIPGTKDQPIVTYCSVGYRSADFARKLQRAGFKNVANLEGSIFLWANEGRPVERGDGQQVRQVHPYNPTWGRLLDKPLRADVPPPADVQRR